MSRWDQLIGVRKMAYWLAGAFFSLAISVAVVAFWAPALLVPVILLLLATHSATVGLLLDRLSDMQAALDMRHIHLKTVALNPNTQTAPLAPDDTLHLTNPDGSRWCVETDRHVILKARYELP